MQAFLRAYVNENQSDWHRWLPIAQLALNSRENSAIRASPFFATHGFYPESSVALVEEVDTMLRKSSPIKRVKEFVERISKVITYCQAALAASAQR